MSLKSDFLKKIQKRTVRVGVIGLGYVGLPLAYEFARKKIHVIGFDLDERKVALLNQGKNYIQDIPDRELAAVLKSGHLEATTDMSRLKEVDAISICVPTPLRKTKDPDMSFIVSATETVKKNFRPGQLVVLESTTYPGTTQEILLCALEESGAKVGRDFFLCFSPERVDPGNKNFNTRNTPKVIGGMTPACIELATKLYGIPIETIVPVSSPACAEMVKLLENTFRAVNIGLANEIAIMSKKLGVDCWEVINAAKTKPFGFMPFYPGPGLGGHCIPIDPLYLSWKLKASNYEARFIQLADTINSDMPAFVVQLVMDALNSRGKCLKGAKILVGGVAYKANIDDYRESPALHIIELLEAKGANPAYIDPHVPVIHFHRGRTMNTLDHRKVAYSKFDVLLLLASHGAFDIKKMVRQSRLVVDTRNCTHGISDPKIVKL